MVFARRRWGVVPLRASFKAGRPYTVRRAKRYIRKNQTNEEI
jgi:hypothetical protein